MAAVWASVFPFPRIWQKMLITQLRDTGEVERGWIGVEIQALTDELAEGFERENDYGALVTNVVPDAPADKAGLEAGDIILEFDGKEIKEMRDLPRIVAQAPVANKYKVVVWRNGATKTLTIRTDRFPEDPVAVSRGGGGGR